jgi:tetratricopeptide (TPR) repeat protein
MRSTFSTLLLFLTFSCGVLAQQKKLDSLIRAVPTSLDTLRVNGLIAVSREMVSYNIPEAIKYIDQAFELARKLNYTKGEATCNVGYGLSAYYSDNYVLAEKYYLIALSLAEKTNNPGIQMRCFNNLGLVNEGLGNFEKAISYYFKALDMAGKLHDESTVAKANNNIGNVYRSEEKYDLARSYYSQGLRSSIKSGDKWSTASAWNNLGIIYKKKGNRDSSLIYYKEALKLRTELEDRKGMALVMNNIAGLYLEHGNYEEALSRYQEVLTLCHETGDKFMTGLVYHNLGESYLNLKNYTKAIEFIDSAAALSEKIGAKDLLKEAYRRYYLTYKAMKDFPNALKYDKKYSILKDTLYSASNQKAILEMQTRYESQQKEAEVDLLHKNKELEAIQLKQDRFLVSGLVSAASLFFIITGLLYNRNSAKKKSNLRLEYQNKLIRAQKEEITSSITYAQGIQRSMLPSEAVLKAILPEHFVLHKPKDIVSGDFYFVEKSGDTILFSAIDCTGHGVPGAFLSFLGMDILQDAVHRQGIIKPSELLFHLDREISRRLRKTTDAQSVRDGMDLAMCSFNTRTNELQVAAAFNPVYIISGGVLEEIKPDKHAIGSTHDKGPVQFTNHHRTLRKGDCIYVLSDGYADQFGGALGKKFKYKPLKELLVANAGKTMREQGELLEKTHLAWKGEMFQVDDVLIMGIRI